MGFPEVSFAGLERPLLSQGGLTHNIDLNDNPFLDRSATNRGSPPMQFLANIDVDNLEKAIYFYQSAFRLKIGRRFGAEGVEMLGSSAPIYLLVKAAETAPTSAKSEVRSYDRHWTPVHLGFVVEDIESAVQQALNAAARLE